jgi:hypothetical protein
MFVLAEPRFRYEFTAEQVKALEEMRRRLNFTPAEVEERLRKGQAWLEWIAAADTLEDQRRRGAVAWTEMVERPRAARRIGVAAKVTYTPIRRVMPRPRGAGRPAARPSSNGSRAGPSDDPDDPEPPRRRPLEPRYSLRRWAWERR